MRPITCSRLTLAVVLSNVPAEMWDHIFKLAIGYMWAADGPHKFLATRRYILHTCAAWSDVLVSNPAFWNCLNVTPGTHCQDVACALPRAVDVPLVARLVLATDPYFPLTYKLDDMLRAIHPHVAKMRVLSVVFQDRAACALAREHLLSTQFLSISQLSVTLIWAPFRAGGDGSSPVSLPHPMPDLRLLRIIGVLIDFSSTPPLGSLSQVIMKNIRQPNYHSIHSFRALAAGSPGLRQMCLHDVGCTHFQADSDPIVFPSLKELDLAFGSDSTSFHRLLRLCRFPSVRKLRVHITRTADVICLLECPGLLGSVVDLSVDGQCAIDSVMADFFQQLHSLRFLDVLSRDGRFISSIIPANRFSAVRLCPHLLSIGITKLRLDVLHYYLGLDDPTLSAVQVLILRHCFVEPPHRVDLDWLEKRYRIVKGARFRDADWTVERW
ncbi:hypothetical protein DFH06DRAFT_1145609 [Mycena polygramma]|nr:hypothetical protein DFH06DRAFT_1145609 [Mycena polygramma]